MTMTIGIADELAKLRQLRDDGTLTPEEFERAKERLLQPEGASGDEATHDADPHLDARRAIEGAVGGSDDAFGEVLNALGDSRDDSLGRAANRYVDLQFVAFFIGIVIFILFFLFVFLPTFSEVNSGMDGFPGPYFVPYTPGR